MRPPILLMGAAAGVLSALIFAAGPTKGAPFGLLLVLLAPLPIALVSLVLGAVSGLAAGAAGAAGLWVAAGPALAGVFASVAVLPIVGLSYLCRLFREVPGGDVGGGGGVRGEREAGPAVEWYPAGRLVIWAALMGSGVAILSLITLGGSYGAAHAALRSFLETVLKAQNPAETEALPLLSAEDLEAASTALLWGLPGTAAAAWEAAFLFNLWLAARVARAAGWLARPWTDFAAIEYPRWAPFFLAAALAVALGLARLPSTAYIALAAWAFAGAFLFAYVLLGLAVVHFLTRGTAWRFLLLAVLYLALLPLWPVCLPLLTLVGLADTFFLFRRKLAARSVNPLI